MATRQRWPSEVVNCIDDLSCAGIGPKEIRRRLATGEAGLKQRYEMPEASFFAIKRRLKKQRGAHSDRVPEGAELTSLDAMLRRHISMMAKETSRIEAIQERRALTRDERSALTQLGPATVKLRRELRELEQKAKAGAKGAQARDKGNFVEMLRRMESNGHSEGQQLNSDGLPHTHTPA